MFYNPYEYMNAMMKMNMAMFSVGIENLVNLTEYSKVAFRPIPQEWHWASLNEPVIDNEAYSCLRFFPDKKNSRPAILIGAPQAGHGPECVDLDKARSLVRAIHKFTGCPVYVVGFKSATLNRKDKGFSEIVEANMACADLIKSKHGSVYGIGVCQAGYPQIMTESLYPGTFSGLIPVASPMDFTIGRGPIQKYIRMLGYDFFKNLVDFNGGRLDGRYLLAGFIYMNLAKFIYDNTSGLYMLTSSGDQKAKDKYIVFDNWFKKTQYLPGHLDKRIVKDLFFDNLLLKGEFSVGGVYVDTNNIKCPLAPIAAEDDNITLVEQAFGILRNGVTFSKKKKGFIVKKAGHFFFASASKQNNFKRPLKFLGLMK